MSDLHRRKPLCVPPLVSLAGRLPSVGATPAEAFLGAPPAHQLAVDSPPGRPGEGLDHVRFEIDYLDPANRRFPILKRVA
jgi:hypothetical protein